MLASSKNDTSENKGKDNDMFSNIFAGLSFPEAPKNTPIQRNFSTPTSQSEDMIELQNYLEGEDFPVLPSVPSHAPAPDSASETSHSGLAPPPTYTEVTAPPRDQVLSGPSISTTQHLQSTLTEQQFNSLYGSEEGEYSSSKDGADSMYPSLQTILTARPPTSTSTSTITSGTVSYSHNPAYREELEEVEGTEETPLIRQDQQLPVRPPPVQQRHQQQNQQSNHLLRENERLQRELLSLQSALAATSHETGESQLSAPVVISSASTSTLSSSSSLSDLRTVQCAPAPVAAAPTQQSLMQNQASPTATLNISQIQDRQLQIQQQLQQNNEMQSQSQTQTGNGQASLKYVCCGSCRQWLSSPRDATFVYCPGCGAVNNCGVKPTEGGTSVAAPPSVSQPPARRVGEASPWYLQCVEKLF